MFLDDVDVFPHPEDVLWLLLLMFIAQQLRKLLAQCNPEEEQMALVCVMLASAETIASRSTLDLRRAYRNGFLGMMLWLGMNLILGRLRATYWRMHELANPAQLLAAAYAGDQIPEANCLLQMVFQMLGGILGHMYMIKLSFPRKLPTSCALPMQVAPVVAGAVEMLGSLTLELLVRSFHNSECDNPQHAIIISIMQLLLGTGMVLTTLDLSGAVYHPVAALIGFHLCLNVPSKNIQLVTIYVLAPCIGCMVAAILAPSAQMFVRVIHHRIGH